MDTVTLRDIGRGGLGCSHEELVPLWTSKTAGGHGVNLGEHDLKDNFSPFLIEPDNL